MNSKVLLIQAPAPIVKAYKFLPFSIAYIAAVLEEYGHRVTLYDMDALDSDIATFDVNFKHIYFNVVGISAHTVSFPNARRLAELIKQTNPDTVVVIGGAHATFTPVETLLSCRAIDVVVIGEGEFTMLELVTKLHDRQKWSDIKGIVFREGEQIRTTAKRRPVELDKVPFPARHLLPTEKYSTQAIVASRGCPHGCVFCSARTLSKFRYRSSENVFAEVNFLLKHDSNFRDNRTFAFLDNTFSSMPKLAYKLCEVLKPLNLYWSAEARIDTCSENMLVAMRQAGCVYVHFGVESGSNHVLKSIQKGVTQEKVLSRVKFARDLGLEVACTFTVGHPEDTEITIQETIDLIRKLQDLGAIISTSIVTPYPGTRLWNEREEFGIKIETTDWARYNLATPVISTANLSSKKIHLLFARVLSETAGYVGVEGGFINEADVTSTGTSK